MRHARKDYDRIQDPDGLIPDDEPVFLVRGQDVAGPQTVLLWAFLAEAAGADRDIVSSARAHSKKMLRWQFNHGSKVPDLPAPRK